MQYYRHSSSSRRLAVVAGLVAAIVFLCLALLLFRPQTFFAAGFALVRSVHAFSYYVFSSKPHFYGLDLEKNGHDFRLVQGSILEISYRDEFVIKSVASDDWQEKYTSVKIAGLEREGNHAGVLLRGLDLVNRVMLGSAPRDSSRVENVYKIIVFHQKDILAEIPIHVLITPQDWLRSAQEIGSLNEQVAYLRKAVSENSQDAGVRRILAALYLKMNRQDDALLLYEEILRLTPDDAATMKELARCYLTDKRVSLASELLRKAVKINERDAEAYAMLGLSSGVQNNWLEAVQYYEQAVKIAPDNKEMRMALGRAYEKAKKPDAALGQYRQMAEYSSDVASWRAQGDIYLSRKMYAQAIEHYAKALQGNPRDAAAYANMATAYAGLGKLPEEMQNLQKAARLLPNDPVVHFNLAAAYERRNRPKDALREYEFVLKRNPADVDALKRLAELTFQSKQYAQAVRHYEKLAARYPQNASVFVNLGFAYGEIQQFSTSAENYEKAIRLGVKNQTIYNNLAYAYKKSGKEQKAVSIYEKVLPQDKKNLSFIAEYYLNNKQYAQAINYYSQIVKKEPKKASSYFSLGYAYAGGKNWDKAIENYLQALKYDCEDDEIYACLGQAYENKGLYAEALKAYRHAYEINPQTSVAARIPKLRIQLLEKNN